MKKLVMIGNGMAGVWMLEDFLAKDGEKYEITVIGEENHGNYNRIMLSNVLQKKTTIEEIITNPLAWYDEHGITLINHDPATAVDTSAKVVTTASGKTVTYDKLLFATGSRAFILPIEGATLPEVIGFRTIADTEKMIATAQKVKKATVIGGGLLGLEAARGLLTQGLDVTVIHLADWLMEMQLDEKAGALLKADLEAQGLKVLLGKATAKILGEEKVTGLEFTDGTTIETDMVIMAVGIRPEVTLAKATGLNVNRGIVVNDYMETSIKDIYAVGECAEHNGIAYGLVAPLYEQGKVLSNILAGLETKPYKGSSTYTQLKVSGCDLFSAGDIKSQDAAVRTIESYDSINNSYKKVFVKDERITGVVLYGDVSEGQRYYSILKKQQSINDFTLVSMLHTGDGSSELSVADMEDDDIICGCNGVSKGDIVNAVKSRDLSSIMAVTKHTKAGGSCGKCKSVIGELLVETLGADGLTTSNGMCGCTTLSHQEVIEEITTKGLRTAKEIRNVLGFSSEEGCNKCRPALNYYLNVAYPKEHKDERTSRFVNERMHGNIQKNGTYSVIPRMRGGETTGEQLQKIGEVAKKYEVPLVKVTGSQRIGLFGVKKEDLPKIWKELDMVSASAYAKAFRSVKTCVGAKFCRFGTQNSIDLGIKIEEAFEFIDTPHKFKVGVSACPRSCVESGVKDFGVIGVENGFQIYIGGNGGTEVIEATLLTTVATEQEVIDICGALLQYYRETGYYAERTAPWLIRLGFEEVKAVLLDKNRQIKLLAALEQSVQDRRANPWREIIENETEKQQYYTVERV